MKKLLLVLLFISACTVQNEQPISNNPFIRNLLSLNLHDLTIDMDTRGQSVYHIDASRPMDYSISSEGFHFIRRGIPYYFIRSIDEQRAVFRYPGFSRGAGHQYPVYIGLVLYQGGLYQAAKIQSSPAADTLEATAYFYSIENIDFKTFVPGPLYQSPGTDVGLP